MVTLKLHPGEQAVIDYMELDSDNPTIVDVGAHHGAFALAAKEKWPTAKIICFEPNPFSIPELRKNVDNFASVMEMALSNELGLVPLYYDSADDMTSSLYRRDLSYQGQTHGTKIAEVAATKLSTVISTNQLTIDYLKIDVEGNEYKVLLGAEEYLNPDIIKNIQFEYNSCALDSRTFFKDYWDLLSPLGYEIMIADKWDTPITGYSPKLEDFYSAREIIARAQ